VPSSRSLAAPRPAAAAGRTMTSGPSSLSGANLWRACVPVQTPGASPERTSRPGYAPTMRSGPPRPKPDTRGAVPCVAAAVC